MKNRISEVQIKKSKNKANKDRSYEHGAYAKHGTHSSALIDLWSLYIEIQMPLPPRTGRGCRVTIDHLDACFGRFLAALMPLMCLGDEEE